MRREFRPLVPMPETMEVLGGIGRTKLYELVNEGQITKVNIGSRSFITADSLEAYLERLVGNAHGNPLTADRTAAPSEAGGEE